MEVKTIEEKALGASENTAFTIGFKMPVRPIDANALKLHQKMLVEHMDGYDVAYNAVPMHRVDDVPTLSLNTLRDAIYEDAVAHGLWEDYDQRQVHNTDFCEKYPKYAFHVDALGRNECAMYVCKECIELREAREDADAFAEELADVIIMSMSVAGKLGIDIDAAIRRKMEINKGRSWKNENDKKGD